MVNVSISVTGPQGIIEGSEVAGEMSQVCILNCQLWYQCENWISKGKTGFKKRNGKVYKRQASGVRIGQKAKARETFKRSNL